MVHISSRSSGSSPPSGRTVSHQASLVLNIGDLQTTGSQFIVLMLGQVEREQLRTGLVLGTQGQGVDLPVHT